MNIGELTKGVASATGLTETNAKAFISAVFEQIAGAAAKGDDVSIPGFGKFAVKDRASREGRNPATGESITIAASKKISFAAAKGLKDKALKYSRRRRPAPAPASSPNGIGSENIQHACAAGRSQAAITTS